MTQVYLYDKFPYTTDLHIPELKIEVNKKKKKKKKIL